MNSTNDFQTLPIVAEYMAGLIPNNCGTILEPTPGIGNLVKAVKDKGTVIAPQHFEEINNNSRFDWVIMNPPFTPMKEGYMYLQKVMQMSDNIVALLPWLVIINSERRLNEIKKFGLISITNLPRKSFPGSRIQVCILKLKKGFSGDTKFLTFTW